MLLKTKCVQCSKEFEPANKRNIYCSVACKQEAYRKRNGIETPSFLKPGEKYHVFKTEKKELIYSRKLTREYTDLEDEISKIKIKLSHAKQEEKAAKDRINSILNRNSSFFLKKLTIILTAIVGVAAGWAIYRLIKFKITRIILIAISIPFIILVVFGSLFLQKKDDKDHEEELLNLDKYRNKLKQAEIATKSVQDLIKSKEAMLDEIPMFELLTEEKTSEIEEKIKQPKFGVPNIKENDAKDLMSLKDLQNAQFKTLDFTGSWKELIGTPEERFSMMIYGKSGHGKSTFAIKLSEYLANNFGTVLYNSAEEGTSLTLKEKVKGINSSNLFLSKEKDFESIRKKLKRTSCRFVILDSVNHMDLTASQVEELKEMDSTRGFISIHQVTKTGEFKGDNKFLHNCDVEIEVENRKPIIKKNRYKSDSSFVRNVES